jgi:hypothetical protein
MGYRIRPSWIWQRSRYDTIEVIVALANDGVTGVPGVLRVYVETPDGNTRIGADWTPASFMADPEPPSCRKGWTGEADTQG